MTDPWGVPQNEQTGGAAQQQIPPQPMPQPPQQTSPEQQQPYGAPGWGGAQGPYPGAPAAGPYGPGPYGYQPVPAKPTNGIALAGAITCFVPIVGLVLSIIGRVRARALQGAGKTAGTVGIILSLIFSGGYGVLVVVLGNSTAADPGCISAEADARSLDSTINADEQSIDTAKQSGDQDQLNTALQKFLDDLSQMGSEEQADAAKARHANVHDAITKVSTDISQFETDAKQYFGGDSSLGSSVEQDAQSMQTDGNAVDSLCRNFGNG